LSIRGRAGILTRKLEAAVKHNPFLSPANILATSHSIGFCRIIVKKTRKVIEKKSVSHLQFTVGFDDKIFSGSDILVTGGLGFIGSSLARRLVAIGAKVTLVDSLMPEYGGNPFNIHDIRDRVKVTIADVRDSRAMDSLIKGRNFLFNLAGQTSHLDSMTDPLTDLNINAAAQLHILEACRRHNRDVKIVFASTRQVYGRPQHLPVDEKHPVNPIDVNGINKLAGEWYHLLYNNVYNIRACALRLTNTYGPGMRVKDARQTFLGVWIRYLIERKPIQVFGDGRQRRDFNFVDDVIEALLLAAAAPASEGQAFNLGHTEHMSLEELAAMLVRLNGSGNYELVPFPPDRQAIDIGDYYGDFRKIDNALGWSPKVFLRKGLARTLEYYRQHHAHYWDATPGCPEPKPTSSS
jgi:UDP-glucose 4-epimerase